MRRFIETGARVIVGVLFGTLAFVVGVALADTLTVPFKIKAPGQTIFAGHWQSNFQAIEDVVNAHIDDANIENAGITGSTKLIDGTVTLAKMATSSVNSAAILDGTILMADIADGQVSGAKITDATIALADMGPNSVNGGNVVDGSIASADVLDNSLTGADVNDASLAAVDLASGAATGRASASTDTSSNITLNGPETTIQTVAITTHTTTTGAILVHGKATFTTTASSSEDMTLRIYRDSTLLDESKIKAAAASTIVPVSVHAMDSGRAANTGYTYTLRTTTTESTDAISVTFKKLTLLELRR